MPQSPSTPQDRDTLKAEFERGRSDPATAREVRAAVDTSPAIREFTARATDLDGDGLQERGETARVLSQMQGMFARSEGTAKGWQNAIDGTDTPTDRSASHLTAADVETAHAFLGAGAPRGAQPITYEQADRIATQVNRHADRAHDRAEDRGERQFSQLLAANPEIAASLREMSQHTPNPAQEYGAVNGQTVQDGRTAEQRQQSAGAAL